jgi:putative DNA primase/helicase
MRAAGYFLTGITSDKSFFLAHSEKSNTGKSTFLDALNAMMGDYAMSADAQTWIRQTHVSKNRGDLARLHGARLVTTSEFEEDARFDEPLIKSITGGDLLTVANKFEKEFSYRPQFKLLFAANHAPRFSGNDDAMVRRARRLPFVHVVDGAKLDPRIRETLTNTAGAGPAILAWAVAGCLDWQREGLPIPQVVVASNAEYQRENDDSSSFFEDRLEFGKGNKMTRKELCETYDDWCREVGIRHPLGPIKLGKRLRALNCRETAHNGTRIWDGVRRRSQLVNSNRHTLFEEN